MSEKRVLVLGNEAKGRPALCRLFSHLGYAADSAPDGMDGLAHASNGYELIVLDASQRERDGLQLLSEIRKTKPDTPVIVLLGCTPVRSATEIVRLGAFDCISEPFELDKIQIVTERAMENRRLLEEIHRLKNQVTDEEAICPLSDVEQAHIARVLTYTRWNQSKAAAILGIDRKTLRNKIREFRLQKPAKP
jgi:DNA-binding NtrC family response regulator